MLGIWGVSLSKGGRVRGRDSSKTDCPFVIKTWTSPMREVYIRADDNLCLQHNHPLDREGYISKLLPTEIGDLISGLWKSGLSLYRS